MVPFSTAITSADEPHVAAIAGPGLSEMAATRAPAIKRMRMKLRSYNRWWGRRDLNPHEFCPAAFEAAASTVPPLPLITAELAEAAVSRMPPKLPALARRFAL